MQHVCSWLKVWISIEHGYCIHTVVPRFKYYVNIRPYTSLYNYIKVQSGATGYGTVQPDC